MGDILMYKQFSKEQMAPARKMIKDLVADVVLRKAEKMYSEHPSDYINYIKSVNIDLGQESYTLSPKTMAQLDLNTIVAEAAASIIPSKYDFINQTFAPTYGYPTGATYMVVGSPGVGKSLFMMTEALNMALAGHKVCYVMLGDLGVKDAILRFSAMYSGLNFADVYKNLVQVYTSLEKAVGDNLSIITLPAGVLTVDEFVNFFKDKDYKAVFCDYDATLKVDGADTNMYDAYGKVYQKLTELTALGKLVFIASQPKINFYTEEYIPLSGAGESSKKIHYTDFMITIGRVVGNPNHLLTMSIVKNRRGAEGDIIRAIRLDNGRFKPIPDGLYAALKECTEKRGFTEKDVDDMINSYIQAQQATGRMVSNNMQQQQSQGQQIHRSPFQ